MAPEWRERIKRDGQHVTSDHPINGDWATHGIASGGNFDVIAIDTMCIDTGNGDAIATSHSECYGVGANSAKIVAGGEIVVHCGSFMVCWIH
jgi:hypothetical protein